MRIAFAALALVAAAAPLFAQSVNIDFGHANPAPTAPPSDSFAGAAGQPGHWMNVPTNAASWPIDGLDGLPSGITLTRTVGAVTTFSVNNVNTTGDHEALLDDFHGFNSVTTVTYQFTGVDPGVYSLFTYAIAPDNASFRTRVFVDNTSSTNPQIVGGSMPVNAFISGVTHAVHDILVGPDTTITVTLTGSGSAGSINGFQLRQGNVELNAVINAPAAFACGCSPITFVGTANGPGGITSYTLERATTSAGPWIVISSGNTAVENAALGVWDTTAVSEGYYLVRLTAVGFGGDSATGVSSVLVDRQSPVASYSNIAPGIILGGTVPINGTASDRCFFSYSLQASAEGKGTFSPIDPGNATYSNPVTNSLLGTWNTATTADRFYDLRLRVFDSCGNQSTSTFTVGVDNTPPTAAITAPSPAFDVCGVTVVSGLANDLNIASWKLEYTGAAASTWTTLASGTANINGTLAVWDTTGLQRGAYTLRLTVVDRATDLRDGFLEGHTTTVLRSVRLGRAGDINNDGLVNNADLSVMLANFGGNCF